MLKSKDGCKRLIDRFVREKLGGDLNALKTFSMRDLASDRDFNGRPYFDGDATEISRAPIKSFQNLKKPLFNELFRHFFHQRRKRIFAKAVGRQEKTVKTVGNGV